MGVGVGFDEVGFAYGDVVAGGVEGWEVGEEVFAQDDLDDAIFVDEEGDIFAGAEDDVGEGFRGFSGEDGVGVDFVDGVAEFGAVDGEVSCFYAGGDEGGGVGGDFRGFCGVEEGRGGKDDKSDGEGGDAGFHEGASECMRY